MAQFYYDIAQEGFRTDLFTTTYQDISGQGWTLEIKSSQPIFTGTPKDANQSDVQKTVYYLTYPAPRDSQQYFPLSTVFTWNNGQGADDLNLWASEAVAQAWATANLDAGVDYETGQTWTVESYDLLESSYYRTVDLAAPGFSLNYQTNTDSYKPVMGSSLSMSLILDEEQAAVLETAMLVREGNLQVVLRKEGENQPFWYGYALPETYTLELTDGKAFCDISFTDGLGILDNINWVQPDGTPYEGKVTAIEAIASCLKGLPSFDLWMGDTNVTPLNQQVWCSVYGDPQVMRDEAVYDNNDVELIGGYPEWLFEVESGLNQIWFKAETMNKAHEEHIKKHQFSAEKLPNCRYVLEAVLRSMGLSICLYDGKWFIFNQPEMLVDSYPKGTHFYYNDGTVSIVDYEAPPVTSNQNLVACYGLRKLRPTYVGPLVKVQRFTDNALFDVYAGINGEIDADYLQSLVEAESEFVRVHTWYDQSGNGHHATQTDFAKQPLIYSYNNVSGHGFTHTVGTNYTPYYGLAKPALGFVNSSYERHFEVDELLNGTQGRTICAVTQDATVDGTSNENPIYCQSRPTTGTYGDLWQLSLEQGGTNIRVSGRATYDYPTGETPADYLFTAATLDDGQKVEDHHIFTNGSEMTQSAYTNPTGAFINTSTTSGAYIGLSYTTASGSSGAAFSGRLAELYVYDAERQDLVAALEEKCNYFFNDEQTILPTGAVRIDYSQDADNFNHGIEDFGILGKDANRAFCLPANNVTLTHDAYGGDLLVHQGKTETPNGTHPLPRCAMVRDTYPDGTIETHSTTKRQDPTNEGLKWFADLQAQGYRESIYWSRSFQAHEAPSDSTDHWEYNARYIGPRSRFYENLDLQAGSSIQIGVGGIYTQDQPDSIDSNIFATLAAGLFSWWNSSYFPVAGVCPILRTRVELTDNNGESYRLYRPVRTRDSWAPHGVTGAVTKRSTQFNDALEGYLDIVDPTNDYHSQEYFHKYVEEGYEWIKQSTATTDEWNNAWYEQLMHSPDTRRERQYIEVAAFEEAEDGVWAPLGTKFSNGEELKPGLDDDQNRANCFEEITVTLPGTLGVDEMDSIYTETGIQVYLSDNGPLPDSTAKYGQSSSFCGTDPIMRSAEADGTGGVENQMFSAWLKELAVDVLYVRTAGNNERNQVVSFSDGGNGANALDLGTTPLGARFVNHNGVLLGRYSSPLMNEYGGLDYIGYQRVQWRTHNDSRGIVRARQENMIFNSLHEMVAWQYLNMFGGMRRKFLLNVLPTRDMVKPGPIPPFAIIKDLNGKLNLGSQTSLLPLSVKWTLAEGNSIVCLEDDIRPLKPVFTGEETDAGSVDTAVVQSTQDNAVKGDVTAAYMTVKGAGSTSYTAFPSTVNDLTGTGYWGTPQTHKIDFEDGEAYITQGGVYTISASFPLESPSSTSCIGDRYWMELHIGDSSGFTTSSLTREAVIARNKAVDAVDEEQPLLTGNITLPIEAGKFVVLKIIASEKGGTSVAPNYSTNASEAYFNITEVVTTKKVRI